MALETSKLKMLHKGLILVLVPLAIQLVFVATLWQLLIRADYQTRRLSHAKEVSLQINMITQDMLDAGRAGAMLKVSGNRAFKAQVSEKLQLMFEDMEVLSTLTADSDQERAAFDHVKPVVKDVMILIEDGIRKIEGRDYMPQIAIRNMTEQITDSVGKLKTAMSELSEIERKIENEAPLAEARSRELVMLWIVGGVSLDIAVAVGLAIFFNKQLLNRLIVMIENTRRVARNAPLLPCTGGGDEIAHLDKVFHEMAQALYDAAEYKKELVSMVSHDLRTPLTSIQTSLALIEIGACGEIPDRVKSEIAVAERSATRLINLINDLLDIEKMEAGKLEMNLQKTNSEGVLLRSLEAVSGFADQHKINMVASRQNYEINADADRLVQVLVNLLSNAIKFSPDGSTISLEVTESNDSHRFLVKDQGPGIPAEFKDAVFERFKQVDGVTSAKLKGTGLGLAICKAIVQGHNGEIGIDSEVGKGTTFWFTIPKSASVTVSTLAIQGDNLVHTPS